MAKRSSKRTNERAKRRAQRAAGQKRQYALKNDWLTTHGMYGFDVPAPKPWKSGP